MREEGERIGETKGGEGRGGKERGEERSIAGKLKPKVT